MSSQLIQDLFWVLNYNLVITYVRIYTSPCSNSVWTSFLIHVTNNFKCNLYPVQIPQGSHCPQWAYLETDPKFWVAGNIHSSWGHKQSLLDWPAPAPWPLQYNKTGREIQKGDSQGVLTMQHKRQQVTNKLHLPELSVTWNSVIKAWRYSSRPRPTRSFWFWDIVLDKKAAFCVD